MFGSKYITKYITFLLSTLFYFLAPQAVHGAMQDHFVTTWKTDNPGTSGSTSITIPTTGGGYNYDVDWDNDGVFDEFGLTGSVTHDFGIAGTYTIRIQGDFPRIYFNGGGDRQKILDVEQWGNIAWSSMLSAFRGCSNLDISALDAPDLSSVTDTSIMFYDSYGINHSLSHWDVSSVVDMSYMFRNSAFNQNISNWNVSSVTNMFGMFRDTPFNQNISNWDVSSVVDMSVMFYNADAFNQDISSWDVSSVVEMSNIFGFTNFNQDISNWNVSSVTNMLGMFRNTPFNQNISNWNVSAVTNMSSMFDGVILSTTNYDSLLIGWNNQVLKPGVTFNAGNSEYCNGEAARNNMIANDSWNITDGGKDCTGVGSAVVEFSQGATSSTDESVADNFPVLLVLGTTTSASTIDVRDLGTGTALQGVGNDYTYSTPQTINIPAGTYDGTTGTAIAITGLSLVDDLVTENTETINFDISNPTGQLTVGDANSANGTQSTLTYSIIDDDLPSVTFDASAASTTEGDTDITLTVTLLAATVDDVTIPFTLSGTATLGSDYTATASPATITAGNTTTTITLSISEDTDIENDETIIVTMGAPTNATQGATTVYTHTIENDDQQAVSNSRSRSGSRSSTQSSQREVVRTFVSFITPERQPSFSSDPVVTPISRVTPQDAEISEQDNSSQEEGGASIGTDTLPKVDAEGSSEPIPNAVVPIVVPRLSLIERVGITTHDVFVSATNSLSSGLTITVNFLKATGEATKQLAQGSFTRARVAFIENFVDNDRYDSYQDPRIPGKLKEHRYEQVAVKIADATGSPLAGAQVTLLSEQKYAVTDDDGIVVFDNVPIGENALEIAFGTYRGSQPVFFKDGGSELLVSVTPNLQSGISVWAYVLSLLAMLIATALATLYLIKKFGINIYGVRRKVR